MTLLELMLVLALLVIIGTLAYPSVKVPFAMQTLRKAGEVVRVQWNKARVKAMKSGQIQMFTFEPETGNYRIRPYYTQQDSLEADAQHGGRVMSGMATGIGSNATGSSLSQEELLAAQQGKLPEDCEFVSVEVQADLRSLQLQQTQPLGANMDVANNTQAPPILFYPDGTTSDAKIVMTNQYKKLYVVVSVRSLTGVVKTSDLVTADEIQLVPK